MNSALEFTVLQIKDKEGKEIDHLPYLRIKTEIADQLKGIIDIDPQKTGYSAFEVDDLLLGYFDDIGRYEKHNFLDLETIRQTFGYYITECFENKEIQKYIRHEDNKDKYQDLRYIVNKLKIISYYHRFLSKGGLLN